MGPENTINGSGLDENDLHSTDETDMWLSSAEPLGAWIQYEFDKIHKLHQMWVWNYNQTIESILGFGLRDVTIEYSTNGTDYTTLGTTHEFARAPSAAGYAHDTVDFGGLGAKYVRLTATSNWGGILPQYGLSEVRFLYIPVNATEPYPDSGATGVVRDVVLGWRAGREAVTHDVYVSTDEQAVIDGIAAVVSVAEASHGPLALDLDTTHYWKVNEVNEAETITTWESAIWSFTTSDNVVVDDFESYNDLDPGDPASKRIFNVWIDGFQVPTNGSLVGYENAPFCEQTIVNGGRQSMPFFYANTGGAAYSEAELTLTPAQNWTEARVQVLVVYFRGTEGNTGQLYAKINGTKVAYGGQAGNVALPGWQVWSIDLASSGASLQSVTKLAVGVDGNGASGTLYFDDIGLYV
ncbi:MAG: discoidin domain-containing protein, partial [Planctomycetota bacterium]